MGIDPCTGSDHAGDSAQLALLLTAATLHTAVSPKVHHALQPCPSVCSVEAHNPGWSYGSQLAPPCS